MNKVALVLFLFIFSQSLFSQNTENLENDCITKNTIKLYSALKDANETALIDSLLENNSQLLVMLDVDAFGHPLRVRKVRTQFELDANLAKRLSRVFRENDIPFVICKEYPSSAKKKDNLLLKMMKEEISIERSNRVTMSIGFPYDLMSDYDSYKVKNKKLSKRDYLDQKIKEFEIE